MYISSQTQSAQNIGVVFFIHKIAHLDEGVWNLLIFLLVLLISMVWLHILGIGGRSHSIFTVQESGDVHPLRICGILYVLAHKTNYPYIKTHIV